MNPGQGPQTRIAKQPVFPKQGIVAPRGDKVAVIALRDPEGFRKHFGEVAA